MLITCEVSLYPLVKDYEELIFDVIRFLKENNQIEVRTHAMSTFIKGNAKDVFTTLESLYSQPFMAEHTSALVMKIINKNLPVEAGFIF